MSVVTFKDQQQALVSTIHQLAVWEYLFNHLQDEYLPRDGNPASKGIRVPGMLQELVSEDVIEDVLQVLGSYHIKELKTQVENIENATVIMEADDG